MISAKGLKEKGEEGQFPWLTETRYWRISARSSRRSGDSMMGLRAMARSGRLIGGFSGSRSGGRSWLTTKSEPRDSQGAPGVVKLSGALAF